MKIKFSDESLSDLRNIEEYLLENWNVQIFDDFLTKLDEITEILSKGHVSFQKYENTEYHKILVTKHNTLIYIIENDILKIIRILQNFQNPEENYKSLQE
nr:type II toxin-antitoxin system RelE/ParE family toxin [uncultured Chryseobacterium sp.]